jgi:hypothetical protein
MNRRGIFQIGFKPDANGIALNQRSYFVILNAEGWAGQGRFKGMEC